MNIIQRFSANNDSYKANVNRVDSRYRTFQDRGPKGLMLHSVGCAQPSAEVFARLWDRANYQVSVHAALQADGTVYQCLPWNYRAWHCGGDANNTHVGVEMTEPAQIRYTTGANFTCSDLPAARAQCRGTYQTAVDLFAMLCEKYGLNPMTAIISHAEGAKKGIASNHGDPEHLWKGLGMGYTMDGFRRDVAAKIEKGKEPDDMSKDEVQQLIREALAAQPKPVPTRDEIMAATNDRWINKYTDLPEWAKPEIRELIEMGAIKGTEATDEIEDTVIDGSIQGFIRPAIVAYRAVKVMAGTAPREALASELEKILDLLKTGA